jgi:hypothetical protein
MSNNVAALGTGDEAALRRAIQVWRDSLISLNKANRALQVEGARLVGVRIEDPDIHQIVDGLREGTVWSFRGTTIDEQTRPDSRSQDKSRSILHCGLDEKILSATLRKLTRRARDEFLDRGLSVLYLALGMLRWSDVDDTTYTSPLLLVPIEFVPVGPKEKPRLKLGEGDTVLNPALALRLQEFGVTLPTVDDFRELSLEVLLEQVRDSVTEHETWTVTEDCLLSAFSFQKEAMYRDLLDNEAALLAHPLVRALANSDPTTQDQSLLFEIASPHDIDQLAPPEETPLILDADSSQRACVAAAVAGHSFVMDGPPGTGKSQTIANMIGALLHAGRTVLFVSDKAAALEVVQNRLAHAGLGNFTLELHSQKANRKEVAHQLAEALDTLPVPTGAMDTLDRKDARELRLQLSAYADAMNRIRQPLGRSLHDVLGEIARHNHLPALPTPAHPANLTREDLAEITSASQRLARAWRPALQARSFLWREVTQRNPMDARLQSAQDALGQLRDNAQQHTALADAFGLRALADVAELISIADRAAARPPGATTEWLHRVDLTDIERGCARLRARMDALTAADRHVLAVAGIPRNLLPDPGELPEARPAGLPGPAPLGLELLTKETAEQLAARFGADLSTLHRIATALRALAPALGLRDTETVDQAKDVLALALAVTGVERPEAAWFTGEALTRARETARTLERLTFELDRAQDAAQQGFTDTALGHSPAELRDLHNELASALAITRGTRRPEGEPGDWCSLAGLAGVRDAINTLRTRTAQLDDAHAAARGFFTDAVLTHTAEQLADRFAAIPQELRGVPAARLEPIARLWCTPDGVQQARDAAQALRARAADLRSAEAAAAKFTQETLTTAPGELAQHLKPLQALHRRFTGLDADAPGARWCSASGRESVRAAATTLRRAHERLEQAETGARGIFTQAALTAPLTQLRERISQDRKGLRKLSPSHRQDIKALTELLHPAIATDAAVERLDLAVEWANAHTDYTAIAGQLGWLLGEHWRDRATDHGAVQAALDTAAEIAEIAPGTQLPAIAAHPDTVAAATALHALRKLRSITTPGLGIAQVISDIDLALTWAQAASRFDQGTAELAGHLCGHWAGRDTDFRAIDQALDVAAAMIELAPGSALAAVAAYPEVGNATATLSALKMIREITEPNIGPDQAIKRFPAAIAWAEQRTTYQTAAGELAGFLRGHWQGTRTDYDSIDHATADAARILDLAPGTPLPGFAGRPGADAAALIAALEKLNAIATPTPDLTQAIVQLPLAAAWSQAAAAHHEASQNAAGFLGDRWQGRNTDFTALAVALATAELILRTAPAAAQPRVIAKATATDPDPAITALAAQLEGDLNQWAAALAGGPAPAELSRIPFGQTIEWFQAHSVALHETANRVHAVNAVVGRSLTVGQIEQIMTLRQNAVDAETALAGEGELLAEVIGPARYRGPGTETEVVTELTWAREMRRSRDGRDRPLSPEQADAVLQARNPAGLRGAHDRWSAAARSITDAFADHRRAELDSEFADFDSGAGLLQDLADDAQGQDEWFVHRDAMAQLREHDLADLVTWCAQHGVPAYDVPAVIGQAALRGWADVILGEDEHLRPIRSVDRDDLVEAFRDLDRQLIGAGAGEIIRAVNARRPAAVDVGQPALIRREGMKKSRHLPVRDLIRRTRETTMALKPCFMMSPLSVSQYLPPDMSFDVVIFDEASQVSPGDAINCVYRGKSLIAAGDDKQLPPTSFFDRMNDTDEDADTDVNDFQSILELAKSCGGFRNLGLRWHYRSRHESLITFSNHRFYGGRLVTWPGALGGGPDVGVEMFLVDGQYRRGTAKDNPREAQQVAERVVHHLETRPGLSIGVVTFSSAQADAVQIALEASLALRPELRPREDRLDGLFVKSLEHVQGDERDVMIFSLGYGPDEAERITTNFGALNRTKGWRRLNVAITRARQRVEVVTSMRSGQIPASANESVLHLVGYLDYAERGMKALALPTGGADREPESPFEESVIEAIRAMGYAVEPQVGTAGYRIDIGVRHPLHEGVYAIGVECDGYAYHSSPVARDRDRLREQVLRGLGWRLHRIWGTAWYRHRDQELERLQGAIRAAVAAPIHGRLTAPAPTELVAPPAVVFEPIERCPAPTWTVPYRPARLIPLQRWIDASENGAHFDMVPGIEALAEQEGPIHLDLVHQRLREAWNIGRVGPRIRDNIDAAIRVADVNFRDGFLDRARRAVPVQVRTPDGDAGQRAVEHVPEEELRIAVLSLLTEARSATQDELLTAVARIFGWGRKGKDITLRLMDVLLDMQSEGLIRIDGEDVRPVP